MQGTRGQDGHVKQYLVDGVVPLSGQDLSCHDKVVKMVLRPDKCTSSFAS
jgi:hypothetical protein